MTDGQASEPPASRPSAPLPPAPRPRWVRHLIWGVVVLTAAAAATLAYVGLFSWQLIRGVADDPARSEPEDAGVEPPRPVPAPDAPFNILVLGLDQGLQPGGRRGARRSDTVMLVSIDPLLKDRVSILSIPRDTRVTIPVGELDPRLRDRILENPTKLAHAHAFGGPAAAMATVGSLLDVEVHRYVRIEPDAFEALVDTLGGVYLCVERDMYKEDPYQDLRIDLRKGCQLLSGEQAAGYARWREDSDIARIQRQHKLIAALVDRALSVGMLPRLPRLVQEITIRVDTNLSEAEIMRLLSLAMNAAGSFSPSSLATATFPGEHRLVDGVSYWIADRAAGRDLVDRLVWHLEAPAGDPVRVDVLDGGAGPRAVEAFAAYLDGLGYLARGIPGRAGDSPGGPAAAAGGPAAEPGGPADEAPRRASRTAVYIQSPEGALAGQLLARALLRALEAVDLYRLDSQGAAAAAPAPPPASDPGDDPGEAEAAQHSPAGDVVVVLAADYKEASRAGP